MRLAAASAQSAARRFRSAMKGWAAGARAARRCFERERGAVASRARDFETTDPKRVEEALRESEALFRTLGETVPDLLWMGDAAGQPLYQNPAWRAYTGMTLEELRAVGWDALHPPDERAANHAAWEAAMRQGSPLTFEGRVRRYDGAFRWFSGRTVPVKDERGRVVKWVGILTDVDARKQAEQQLRDSEARLQLALAAGNAASWDLDLATGRTVWSESHFQHAADAFGGPEEPFEAWADAVLSVDRPRVREEWARAESARDLFRSEHRVVQSNGSVLWANAIGRFFYDERGAAIRFVGVQFDISARKRAEQALSATAKSLARERERLAVALRAGALGAYEWRVGSRAAWWSPETYPVFGVDPEQFEPTLENFTALIHPDDREEVWRKTEESIARREVFRHEYRILRPDGAVRWIFNQSVVSVDAEARPERITGVAADITERKLAEEALRRSENALIEADRRKDEFLATLAHELRNPLAPIRTGLAILRAGRVENVPRTLEVMERQLGHMVRLIDDLLDVSRVSRGKIVLQKELVELHALVESALETSRPIIARAPHELVLRLPDGPVWLEADVTRIAQVLSNLLNNAAKYTRPGGRIELTAAALDAPGGGAEVELRVTDTGVGIPRELLPRVFELFTQLNRTLERSQGGLGIGLSLAKKLVELHGGSIRAESEGAGAGSTFTVRLPAARRTPSTEISRAGAVSMTTVEAGHRVLVVDDNQDAAETLAVLLQIAGYATRVAHDGESALECAAAFQPGVVFLDLGMPGMSGLEVAARMRKDPRFEGSVLVAVTGWGTEEDRQRSRQAGFDFHLTKPVDMAAMESVLGRSFARADRDASADDAAREVRANTAG
jgi:PAS domain S-box-containing protein